MDDINAIGDLSQSHPQRSINNRNKPVNTPNLVPADAIEISEEAQDAAARINIALRTVSESEQRREMVASAKQRVLEGSHRMQAVVSQVTSRLSPFI